MYKPKKVLIGQTLALYMIFTEEVNTNLSTFTMVLILLCVVKGVFICFALVARCCYRYSSNTDLPTNENIMSPNDPLSRWNFHVLRAQTYFYKLIQILI